MFGNLVGYGDYGFVYEDETEINGPDGSVIKIMNLNNLCNLQQYNMFIQLQNHQDQGIRTPGLPFVFQTFRGIMTANVLNILSYTTTDAEARRRVRTTFPAGTEYGIVNMERLPCIAQNQFCGRNLKDKGNQREEQSIYEAMVTYLYDSGWWVRDLIDPRNIGYNIHGEPIWFDPMVARRRGFPGFSQQALEQCHEEVVAYPTSYRKAIESGRYFTERHGYGLFNSEMLDEMIICGNCNWSWKRSEGGDDPFKCHKCYFDNQTYHSEAMNEEMFKKRYGWKVGSADTLSTRTEEFPISINFAYHNYPHFRLGDLFGAERWDDIEWTTTEPPRQQYEEWPEVKWNDQYRSTTGIFYSPAGRIGLQLRSELVLMPNTWSGISGFLDAGETPYDAVVREIHEESGLPMATIKQWKHQVIWDDGSHRTYLFYVDTEFEPEVNEFKWEWDDWRWATLDAWKQVPNLHPGMEAALNLTQQSQ